MNRRNFMQILGFGYLFGFNQKAKKDECIKSALIYQDTDDSKYYYQNEKGEWIEIKPYKPFNQYIGEEPLIFEVE